ncbi:MAG: hypothetical protein JXR42_04680 [Gammaproteobacteria bacterium]|nr:hypothetical protein [Gammaproteobacteria bacterium]
MGGNCSKQRKRGGKMIRSNVEFFNPQSTTPSTLPAIRPNKKTFREQIADQLTKLTSLLLSLEESEKDLCNTLISESKALIENQALEDNDAQLRKKFSDNFLFIQNPEKFCAKKANQPTETIKLDMREALREGQKKVKSSSYEYESYTESSSSYEYTSDSAASTSPSSD